MSDLTQKIKERCEARADDLLFLRHAQAVAVIRAVLDLHRPGQAQRHYGDRRPVCRHCNDGRSVPEWPCKTLLAVASALGVREDGE